MTPGHRETGPGTREEPARAAWDDRHPVLLILAIAFPFYAAILAAAGVIALIIYFA